MNTIDLPVMIRSSESTLGRSPNAMMNNGDIAVAAQESLVGSCHCELQSLSCELHDGALVLRGRVSSYYRKQLAQERVRIVVGSLKIHNAVEVICRNSGQEDEH